MKALVWFTLPSRKDSEVLKYGPIPAWISRRFLGPLNMAPLPSLKSSDGWAIFAGWRITGLGFRV